MKRLDFLKNLLAAPLLAKIAAGAKANQIEKKPENKVILETKPMSPQNKIASTSISGSYLHFWTTGEVYFPGEKNG